MRSNEHGCANRDRLLRQPHRQTGVMLIFLMETGEYFADLVITGIIPLTVVGRVLWQRGFNLNLRCAARIALQM